MEMLLTDIILPVVGTVVTALIGILIPPAIKFLKSNMSKSNAEEMESHMRQFESVLYDALDTVEEELRDRLDKMDFKTDNEVVNAVSQFVNTNGPIVMEKLGLTQEYINKKAEAGVKRLIREIQNEKKREAASTIGTSDQNK